MPSHLHVEGDKSDEDDFQDALEQKLNSPLPTTRVEKTDSKPSHGEVPGTAAHEKRKEDAEPDEVEIIPDQDAGTTASVESATSVPKTVVEKVEPESPSHGEVPGTDAHAMRQADAAPDEVKRAPDTNRAPLQGPPSASANESSQFEAASEPGPDLSEDDGPAADADAADDFDDFAEGEEGDEDDDFGAFDEGFEDVAAASGSHDQQTAVHNVDTLPPLLDFDNLKDADSIEGATAQYMEHLFPNMGLETSEEPGPPRSSFLNERSQSLWAQLVAPPPLQPPNWVKSRTRRLFLVSLGVPVDLDEILPASKQKKLVLPSIDLEQERGRTASNGSATKSKPRSGSSVAVAKTERRRKGPQAPEFDDNAARLLCSTTNEALEKLSTDELRAHTQQLSELMKKASATLEYWLIQRDSASGEKEAFEEVINNFVKHAKKIRT